MNLSTKRPQKQTALQIPLYLAGGLRRPRTDFASEPGGRGVAGF